MYVIIFQTIISKSYNAIYDILNDQLSYNYFYSRSNYKFKIKCLHLDAKFKIISISNLSNLNKRVLLTICDDMISHIDNEFKLNL